MQNVQYSTAHRQYDADGFYIYPKQVIPDELVQRAITGMDDLRAGEYETGIPPRSSYWNPGDSPHKLCKIEMPQIANRAIMELVSHPSIGKIAHEITGAEMVQVWWVQLLGKPPTPPNEVIQTNIGWHQDRQYWKIWEKGSELLTAWVALTDVTVKSGAMRFVRGSRKWGLLDKGDFYGQDHEAQRAGITETTANAGETGEEVDAILAPGSVSFHHNLTFHASGPNRSSEMRRSFAIHMRTERSRSVNEERKGLSAFIDDSTYCPVIYGKVI